MTQELLRTEPNLFTSTSRASSESKNSSAISIPDMPDPVAESSLTSLPPLPPHNNDHESSRSFFAFNFGRRKNSKSQTSTSHLSIDESQYSQSAKQQQQQQQHSLYHNNKYSFDDLTNDTTTSTSNNVSDVEKSPRNSLSKELKDLTSETSSMDDRHYHHLQQQPASLITNNDIARITRALATSENTNNENNSHAIPANMNPVSRLLKYSEITSKACEALGRTIVQTVDSYTINSFLDNFLAQHTLSVSLQTTTTTTETSEACRKNINSLPSCLLSNKAIITTTTTTLNDHTNQVSPSSTMTPSIEPNTTIGSSFMTSTRERRKDTILTKLRPSDRQQQQQQKQQKDEDLIKSATPVSVTSSLSSLDTDSTKVTLDLSMSMRRKNAIKELMQTEKKYLEDLRVLVTHFFEIIKDARCITREHRKLIMRNGEAILQFQEKFADALEEAHGYDHDRHELSSTPDVKNIAQCFITWGPRFDIYMEYCVGQDKAVDIYRYLLDTNDAFSNLMERTHSFLRVSLGFGLGSKLTFDDYLITPFQRVFRYRLMLQSITKTSKPGSDETMLLAKAQDVMHDIATKLNSAKSRLEAEKKTDLFLTRLKSDWTIPKRWHSTLGTCLLIGTLEVRQVKDGRKPKRYGCALFGTYMIIVKAKKGKSYYEPRHWFPLRMFELEDIEDIDGSMVHAWKLYNDQHAVEFGAMCEQEKQIWLEELRKAINESKAQYENHLWDTQNRGNVIEQLFVSSFDSTDSSKSQQQSPASNASSVSSLQSVLSRHESINFNNYNNNSNTGSKTNRMSKLLFMHHLNTNGHRSPITNDKSNHRHRSRRSVSSVSGLDDSLHCITSSSANTANTTTTTTTPISTSALASMYPNHSSNNSQHYCQRHPGNDSSRQFLHLSSSSSSSPIDSSLLPSNSSQSSFLRHSQSNMNDLREFFHSNVAGKWSQRKYTQYQSRRVAVDAKFEDVSTTPILTARSQARQDRKGSFEQWRRRSTLVDDHYQSYNQSSNVGYYGTPRHG
ncbi:uncharacterized protein BX664DRAFT_319712 [Halteromyces radiatus]|uniref:uncharacterized protein n=1 Tax=Halteromyces radiatus TaxID=101107 RepID=UPI00221F09E3|nr:uncharacterized protein BX664DRAFT_319712 [Halteromyces radiatus]KAI8098831.1 hypothetical protein BX664DRAFT_319712 [Halteromyces radiatus]